MTRASALHGQLGLPESGAAALWDTDTAADGCCPPLEVLEGEREVRSTQGTEGPHPPIHLEGLHQRFAPAGKEGDNDKKDPV